MIVFQFENGDKIEKQNRCLIAKFAGKRKVMGSSAWHNGGYKENLTAIFNHDVHPGESMECPYKNQTEEYRKKFIIEELGLNYETTAYMATIVSMDDAVIETMSYGEITITAVVTASLELNATRVGDNATCYEKKGENIDLRPGTINTMLFCNCDMTPGCMARAIMTATEAKTAQIQELLIPSLHSSGIATGSGTDNIMIIADGESENTLTYAGSHGKLGELIGKTVMKATKGALFKHSGLSSESQHNLFARICRYDLNREYFEERVKELPDQYDKGAVMEEILNINKDGVVVGIASLYVHLLDQLQWKMISEEEALICATFLLRQLMEYMDLDATIEKLTDIDTIERPLACSIIKIAVDKLEKGE